MEEGSDRLQQLFDGDQVVSVCVRSYAAGQWLYHESDVHHTHDLIDGNLPGVVAVANAAQNTGLCRCGGREKE